MLNCSNCNHPNREGTIFCESCGQPLYTSDGTPDAIATKQLQDSQNDLGTKATWGTARFGEDTSIILHVRDAPEPITLQPTQEIILGRLDPASQTSPDLDMTPYGALEKGVSRIHAAIRQGDETLTLVDLGSVNGTRLNGERLIPNQPRVLRDGDEIRLGKLIVSIFFR